MTHLAEGECGPKDATAIFEMMSFLSHQEPGAATQTLSERHSRERSNSLLLWAIVLAGTVLRLIALGHKSFWLDEIASVAISRRPALLFWHFLWHDEGNMALYYVLLKPWLHFGYSESAVRLLSVIPGVLSIPLMYVLGARLFGRSVGVLSAVLFALSTCAVSVSQDARAYSLLLLLVLLSTWLFVQWMEHPGYPAALAYALVAGIACYVHYFGVLVPAAHAVSVFALPAHRRPRKMLLAAWSVIALLAAPILWLMHAQDVGHISWVQPPSWLELYHLGVFLAADGGKAVGAVLLGFELVLAGLFVARLRSIGREGDSLLRWRHVLVLSLTLTPVILALLISMVRPAFYHRFLIICLPGWLLMIALGALNIHARAWRIGAIAIVCLLSLTTTALYYGRATEDWRGAVTYLIANARPGDRVLYYQSVGQFAAESYRAWLQPPDTLRPQTIGIAVGTSDWKSQLDDAARVWLVLYRAKPQDEQARAIEKELDTNYAPTVQKEFAGITVLQYRLK
jgi:mannosyltransferase